MSTLVLRTVVRVVSPMVLLYSLRLLLAGHDAPGGGFVGGLVAALAVALVWLAFGPPPRDRWWERGVAVGLALSAATGLAAVVGGGPFLGHAILYVGPVKLPTSLFFDLGVYVVVVSATLAAIRSLWEASSR